MSPRHVCVTLRRYHGGQRGRFGAEVAAALGKLTLEEQALVGLYFRAWLEQEEETATTVDLENPRLQARMRLVMEDSVGSRAMRLIGEELTRRLW